MLGTIVYGVRLLGRGKPKASTAKHLGGPFPLLKTIPFSLRLPQNVRKSDPVLRKFAKLFLCVSQWHGIDRVKIPFPHWFPQAVFALPVKDCGETDEKLHGIIENHHVSVT